MEVSGTVVPYVIHVY